MPSSSLRLRRLALLPLFLLGALVYITWHKLSHSAATFPDTIIIQGQWKRVHAELGLPPFQDTVQHPKPEQPRVLRYMVDRPSSVKAKPAPTLFIADDVQESDPPRVSYPELMRSLQNIMLQERAAAEGGKRKGRGGSRGKPQGK
ncbi:hypothetical protein BDV98DRAFT_588249 [Pterulicium gracile]|uniref:Uncharacterized protein n=1 Tax=Pterulicium gracile TaxID=1884261 RepID=A0A5C3R0H8_9AGAR|nr:hypothetical protein BDV98DRAFT_588249 [Pterula gracilis]